MAVESLLFWSGLAAEAALVLLLLRGRVFASLPAFFLYICWSFLSDTLMFSVQSLPPTTYFRFFEVQMVIDSAMIFAVLVELAWSVLRPLRSSLPRGSWIVIAFLVALAGLLLWPLAGLTLPMSVAGATRRLSQEGAIFFRLQQTFAILRLVVFLGMAGFSQLLSIGWRNRELQIATGLGFYSTVSLAVTVLHTHQIVGPQYHWLDEAAAASYLGALGYWVFCFATKEAERRDFTPQMQGFMLLVGGAAKASRIAVTSFEVTKSRHEDHR